ncbi:hypothetical protein NP493_1894g00011 [Ridgeia piscesae]|uniref:WAP domain-containing protein n=1 Tax=Ridgeia piscesae TaxID=27915 RepID=A0AAD9JS83_RIDPI|nr:hypothetical protein NP493_1894g00011 [Ridgeia piscesae]
MCKLPNPKCKDDADCPGNEKCCRRRICGGMECGPPAPEKHQCSGGQVWGSCASPCDPTCKSPFKWCKVACYPGCVCPKDRPIFHKGKCITLAECPK